MVTWLQPKGFYTGVYPSSPDTRPGTTYCTDLSSPAHLDSDRSGTSNHAPIPLPNMLKPTAANMSSRASASRTAAVVKAPARGRCVAFRPVQRTGRPQLIVRAETEASEQFDVDSSKPPEQIENTPETLGPRDDDVLPANLADAVVCAAKATAAAIQRSNNLCQFWDPISGPQFPNRGDQEKFWKMTRRFTEELSIALGTKKVKAGKVPSNSRRCGLVDSVVGEPSRLTAHPPPPPAASSEVDFALSSLTDRRPVQPDDEVIVVACPDPQGASECMAMVATIMDQDEKALNPEGRPVILFNPRLSSGDVGLGLNARRMRSKFTDKFVVTYSLRPIGDYGSVFRCYPR
eukprot:gene20596-27395_t